MLIVVAKMNAQVGKEDEMEKALRDIIPKVEFEEGTLAYVLHRMKKKPQNFLMYEKYRDKEALAFHSSTPYFAELFGKIAPLMDGDPTIEVYEMLSSVKEKG
jgi:quinol monooxygenase YgiN